jgi:hypothetical protein
LPSILGVDFVRRRSTNVITQPIPAFIGLPALLPIWLINVGGRAHVGEEQLMAIKRIGILTGAGDVPGLNAVRRSYVRSEATEDFRSSTLTLGLPDWPRDFQRQWARNPARCHRRIVPG